LSRLCAASSISRSRERRCDGLVELQPLDRLGRRGDGADRARHAHAHQEREQQRHGECRGADDGAVHQPVEVGGRLLDREVLADQPGLGP
jgi:hypothetical protein